MARFMDFHDDPKLPAEVVTRIAEETRNAKTDRFGVRQIELYHNPTESVLPARRGRTALHLHPRRQEAIRRRHAALGVPCGDVHQVDSLT